MANPPTRTYRAVLDAEHTFTRRYETAAWWTEILAQPQTVEAQRSWWSGDWHYTFHFSGVITAQYMPSLFAGVPVGAGPDDRGTNTTYSLGWSRWDMEHRILKGEDSAPHWNIPALRFEAIEGTDTEAVA